MAAWGGSGFITCAALALTAAVAVVDGCSSNGNACRVNCGSSGAGTSSSASSSSGAVASSSSSAVQTGSSSSAVASSSSGSSSSGGSSGVPEGGGSQCSLPSAGYDIYVGGMPDPACPGTVLLPGSGWFSYTDVNVDAGLDIDASALSLLYQPNGCDGPNDCALHVTGGGYSEYAGVGFPLNGANTPSDAGAGYTGLQVWVKGTTTGTRGPSASCQPCGNFAQSNNTIKVVFVTSVNRMGDEYSAYCPTQGGTGSGWVLCQMPFASLKRDGYSSTPPVATDTFDVSTLVKIQFQPSPYTLPDGGVGTESFDFWLDDIAFYSAPDGGVEAGAAGGAEGGAEGGGD
jgi:hypothetical protein